MTPTTGPIKATVVVIAKTPTPGRVKTRLCPPCTPVEAARIAEASLATTLDAVRRSRCRRSTLALDGAPGRWFHGECDIVPQVSGGLGRRLAAALGQTQGPALAIGMDTPQLGPLLLDAACERLLDPDVDAVLGPAADGGYWAIGMRAACPGAFTGVAMSTATTGARQLARLRTLGLRVAMLPELRDVDTFDDAVAVADDIADSRFAHAVHEIQRAVAARDHTRRVA